MGWLIMENDVCITEGELENLKEGLSGEDLEVLNETMGVGKEATMEEVNKIGMAKIKALTKEQFAVLDRFKDLCQELNLAGTFADVINLSTSSQHMMQLGMTAGLAIKMQMESQGESELSKPNKEEMH